MFLSATFPSLKIPALKYLLSGKPEFNVFFWFCFSDFSIDLTLLILKSHFWLTDKYSFKETQTGLSQFFALGNNAHCLKFSPSMLVSELNEIKGSQFCMLITTYTVLGSSNYSGITIDLLKKTQSFSISYCPKSMKKLATVLRHFQLLPC